VLGRCGPGLAVTLALAVAVGGCGGSKDEGPVRGKDSGIGAGRVKTRDIILESARRPPRHKIILDGQRFSAGRRWLLPLELKLTNRRKHKLVVGQISAQLIDAKGRRYSPIYADGRRAPAPVFADRSIRPGEAVHTLVLYRVPKAALRASKVRVRDPARTQQFDLSVF
jgi:hypothetical protein